MTRSITILSLTTSIVMLMAVLVSGLAQAAPTRLVADLSDDRVDITSTYHGTDILLFGAYEGEEGDDLVLVVSGPETDIQQRRKAKRAGIWVNVETVTWQSAPSFYHIFSTRALEDKKTITRPASVSSAPSASSSARTSAEYFPSSSTRRTTWLTPLLVAAASTTPTRTTTVSLANARAASATCRGHVAVNSIV